ERSDGHARASWAAAAHFGDGPPGPFESVLHYKCPCRAGMTIRRASRQADEGSAGVWAERRRSDARTGLRRSALQVLLEQRAHELGVRAQTRAATELADEGAAQAGLAVAPGLGLVGAGRDDVVDDASGLGCVADLAQPAGIDDRCGVAAFAHQHAEHFASSRAVDVVV